MVVVGTGKSGSRFLKKNWPITEGLTAGTTIQTQEPALIAEEKSNIRKEEKKGIQ